MRVHWNRGRPSKTEPASLDGKASTWPRSRASSIGARYMRAQQRKTLRGSKRLTKRCDKRSIGDKPLSFSSGLRGGSNLRHSINVQIQASARGSNPEKRDRGRTRCRAGEESSARTRRDHTCLNVCSHRRNSPPHIRSLLGRTRVRIKYIAKRGVRQCCPGMNIVLATVNMK